MSATHDAEASETVHNQQDEEVIGEDQDSEEEEEGSDENKESDSDSDYEERGFDDDSREEEDFSFPGSYRFLSLLSLCRNDYLPAACKRVDYLIENNKIDKLKQEIFEEFPEHQNTPLHEALMSVVTDEEDDKNRQFVLKILDVCKQYPDEARKMLIAQFPQCDFRTPLHSAAWSNCNLEKIIKPILILNPEALFLLDLRCRTPEQVFNYYFCSNRNDATPNPDHPSLLEIKRLTKSWTQHRFRVAIHLCAIRYFVTKRLNPFDNVNRKEAGIRPKPWYFLSVLGTLIQREMNPLVVRILEYTGGNAKVQIEKVKRPAVSQRKGRPRKVCRGM